MKLLLVFTFLSSGMKGSNEDKSKRGGFKIYVIIVAVKMAIITRNLNSLPLLPGRDMRKSKNSK
jgi:hypothetical protein